MMRNSFYSPQLDMEKAQGHQVFTHPSSILSWQARPLSQESGVTHRTNFGEVKINFFKQ